MFLWYISALQNQWAKLWCKKGSTCIIKLLIMLYYVSNILSYNSITMIIYFNNYYASTMYTFELEYPYDDLLEYYKFDELSEFLQSHFRIIIHLIIFQRGKSSFMLWFLLWVIKKEYAHNLHLYLYIYLKWNGICK